MGECHLRDAVLIYQMTKSAIVLASCVANVLAHRIDELDARKVHIVFGVLVDNIRIVYRLRFDIFVSLCIS
jgi:hypothetical protein